MKKILLSLSFQFVTLTAVMAAKSPGTPIDKVQPDGTTLTVQLIGDEQFSWLQTTDGILLVQEGDAYYIASTDGAGQLTNSGILAHNAELREQQETEVIRKQDKDCFFKTAETEVKSKAASASLMSIPGYPSKTHCPHMGRIRVPVILMEYPDKPLAFDREVHEEYFNGTTRTPYSSETKFDGYSSVAQFFKDASFGQLEFVFDLYGPYTTTNDHDYYGKKNRNIITLETEAVRKADEDIDFSQYDSDGDGKVDMVYVFYAGTGANISGNDYDVWPSCFPGNQSIITSDGVKITTIGAANELTLENYNGKPLRAGIGVTCHEMSHGLGLPDLYNTGTPKNPETGKPDYSNCGPEDWDLMDGGENLYYAMWPCQYTAWERDIMGWFDIEELTETEDITIYPLNDKEGRGKAYRITNPANTNEYYVIENNSTSEWNYYQNYKYGSGLLIYHLKSSSNGFSMTPNNTYGKPNITILPADGYIMGLYNRGETIMYNGVLTKMPTDDSEFRTKYFHPESKGDPYPGLREVTKVARFNNYYGNDMADTYSITDIRKNDDGSISFHFGISTTDINGINARNGMDDTVVRKFIDNGRIIIYRNGQQHTTAGIMTR